MEDWALIRRLAAEGVPKARIAERLGISRTTVVKAVSSDAPPRYERTPGPTSFTSFEARVRALLAEIPEMPATVLAERVGWTGSITWFRENVKRLRPEHRPIDPADRLVWEPGDAAQCDLWFPPQQDPARGRHDQAVAGAGDHRRALAVHDRADDPDPEDRGPAAGVVGADPAARAGAAPADLGQRDRASAAGSAAPRGSPRSWARWRPSWCCCRRSDPESKGVVERRNGWFETSFMPGRTFASPADFNAQFADWLARANARVVRTIKAPHRSTWLDADRAAMLPLPPIPLHLGWRNQIRLGPGLLRPPRHQRLLRRPDRDRPDGRRRPPTWTGSGSAARAGSWPTTPGSGPAA